MAIWQHRKQVLGIFLPRMHRDGYLGTSGQKSDLAIRYVLAISLVRMRRNSVNSASGVKTALTIVFSDYDFL